MKLAICQLAVCDDKSLNIERASRMLFEAGECGADMAILPEMFSITYSLKLFDGAAEPLRGECFAMLSEAARANRMTVVGGSFPERADGAIYNTSLSFGKSGEHLGTYRKAHLFDVDLEGFRFVESELISPCSSNPLVFDADVRTGVSICFDVRFPEWFKGMADEEVELIALPAAFSLATGPKHWELLIRARALDNQCFFAGVSPAQSKNAYGFSMVAAPDGRVVERLGADEELKIVDIDVNEVYAARRGIPLRASRERLSNITK